jgi:hypothetical protein
MLYNSGNFDEDSAAIALQQLAAEIIRHQEYKGGVPG